MSQNETNETEASELTGRETSIRLTKKKRMTKSQKAGLVFPVFTIRKRMIEGNYSKKVGVGAAVYMAAVLEYLASEVLELSKDVCRVNKRHRIIPRHIMLAIRNDEELEELCHGVHIASGGVVPYIHNVLLPKHTYSKKKTTEEPMESD